MLLLISLLPFAICLGHKQPSSGVSAMPKLFQCINVHFFTSYINEIFHNLNKMDVKIDNLLKY
jgi:hypothetical protein